MPITAVSPAGKFGLVTDLEVSELPMEAWDDCRNVRFQWKGAKLSPEAQGIYGTASVAPLWAIPVRADSGHLLWLYVGVAKAYCIDAGVHTNVTRQVLGVDEDYTATIRTRWVGGILGTIPVLTEGVSPPQAWISPASGTLLVDLPNWPADTTCNHIGVYKNFLVALDVTKSGTRYPTLVKWSHEADPGAVPISWDETDPTRDAGEQPLSESPGYCVAQLPMRDLNVIYKQDSVWGMQYIGGTYIFRFFKMFGDFGCPAKHQVTALPDGTHIVFTGQDLMRHNGQEARSIVTGFVRSVLDEIPEDSFQSAFLFSTGLATEVWLCWASSSSVDGTDQALVWNWETKVFSRRTVPNLYHALDGVLDFATGPDNWDSDSVTWDGNLDIWQKAADAPLLLRPVGLHATELLWLDSRETGITTPAYIQRSAIGFPLKTGNPPDVSSTKFLRRVWPRITGTAGDTLQVEIGSVMELNEPLVWKETRTWIIGTTKKVDVTITGITFAIRISSTSGNVWTLSGIDWDYDFLGEL
jgi:hypothetical protein